MFQRKYYRPRLLEYENDLFTVIEAILDRIELIEDTIDASNVYGIFRSLFRGITVHIRNVEVPIKTINVIN